MSPAFHRLSGWEELELDKAAGELALLLTAKGLPAADAEALAHNAALLWLAADWEERPDCAAGVLSLLSLQEILDLCGEYRRLTSGEIEWAVNTSFEEAVE